MRKGLAVALVAGGCGGPDVEALGKMADAVETIDAERRGHVLLAGLSEPGVGVVGEACAAKLNEAVVAPSPAQRATAFSEALSGPCPSTCADFGQLAVLEPAARMKAVLQSCDPDPVFGRPELAALRAELDPIDYLAARTLLEPALSATRGSDLGRRYELLAVDTAISLAGRAPSHGAPSETSARTSSNLDAAGVTSAATAALTACHPGVARLVLDAQGNVLIASGDDSAAGLCVATALTGVRFPGSQDGGYAVADVSWASSALAEPTTGAGLLQILGAQGDIGSIFGEIGDTDVVGLGGLGSLDPNTPGDGMPVPGTGGMPDTRPKMTVVSTDLTGSLSKEIVRRVLLRQKNQLLYCYEVGLKEAPTAAGSVDLEVSVGPDGAVTEARATSAELPSKTVDCMRAKAKTWAFPAPEGGGLVVAKYALTFSP
jgi:hypothetical protein